MGFLDFLKKKKVARPLISIDADTKATINLTQPEKKPRRKAKRAAHKKAVHAKRAAKARPKRKR